MKYSFEIIDTDKDMTVSFRNLDPETIELFTNENNIAEISKNKYYLYGIYDKVSILNHPFMVLKSTKQSVILLHLNSN